jgi:hypothetical protein
MSSSTGVVNSGGEGVGGGLGGSGGSGTGGGVFPGVCRGVTNGVEFGPHCYVDLTGAATATWQTARASCTAYGQSIGAVADLAILESAREESFVIATFLQETASTEDAWIGLHCDELTHPDVGDCYCVGGCADDASLEAKRANWTWIDNSGVTFTDWQALNPNGDGRCAALAFHPDIWGFVDRSCAADTFVDVGGQTHTYRTICEIVPG